MAVDAMTLQQKFIIEEDNRTTKIFWFVFVIEIALGISLHFIEPSEETSDFFEQVAPERVAKLVVAKKEEPVVADAGEGSSGTAKKKSKGSSGSKGPKKSSGGGGGDPRAKVTAKGVLGIISGKVDGAMGLSGMAASSILGAGGMAEDIDAVIGSIGGLKVGGKSGSGRKGKAGIGYGDGYGAGFGGGGGGTLDDLIGGLGGADALSSINLKKKGNVKITTGLSSIAEGSTGERDMDEIRAVVMERIGGVKYAYNSMLKTQPGLKGKITVEFTIGSSGKVVNVRVLSSNMNSPALEQKIIRIIRRWTFRAIDSGDVKVVYPFIFAPGS